MTNKNTERKLDVRKAIIRTMIVLAIVGVYTFITQYFILVPINPKSVAFWVSTLVLLVILAIVFYVFHNNDYVYSRYSEDYRGPRVTFVALIAAGAILLMLIVVGLGGSTIFHATQYANLINIEDGDASADIPDIEENELVIVDMKTAQKLGDRQLAYIPNSSYYDVDDEYNLVQVGDVYYRVSPVNYGGLFKASKAGNIPAYIQVEATNRGEKQNAKAITLAEPYVYSPSAYWGKDLARHLHFNYPTYMFGKSFFEIDNEGTPYWITPVRTHTIWLFGGEVEKSVVITNAVTGECQEYSESDVPMWIDHVHSVDYLFNLVSMHYQYQGGFWNAHFGKTNVYKTSYDYKGRQDENEYTPFEGYNWLIGKDGQVYAYTGITPANNAETNLGFVLVNARTAEAKFYPAAGAEEGSAQSAAEGLLQNLRYSASFPTIVSVDGEFAYFMPMKDNAGLVQRYAICNVENYSKVVEASTIEQAIAKYKGGELDSSLNEVTQESEETHKTESVSGKVTQVVTAEKNGNTYYFFKLEGDENVYMSSIKNSNLQPIKFLEYPKVTLVCYDSNEAGIRVVTKISFN